jgi:hypothetical protein
VAMGTWGAKAFQNDSAADWLAELEAGGIAMLRATLEGVADTAQDDEVDVDDGASAIAAAEIVAAALGRGRDRLTIAANAWLDRNQGVVVPEDMALATHAVKRVVSGESELRALWDESGPASPWHADVRTLLERLAGEADAVTGIAPATNARQPSRPRKVNERDKQVLVTFLRARGLEPTAQQMARIRTSQDDAEIRRWLSRAVDAPSVAAVLDE